MPSYDETELPSGWVREYDSTHKHPFWVDTSAKPPRAIWTHPYEDEQFLSEHPDIKERLAKAREKAGSPPPSSEAPPPYTPRRHSFSGKTQNDGPSASDMRTPRPMPVSSSSAAGSSSKQHRGFFGKIKDKTIGTKEEREEAKRQEALYMQRRAEERKRQIEELRRQQAAMPASSYCSGSGGYYSQQQQPYGTGYGQGYGQSMYGPPVGSPFGRRGYGGGGFGRQGYSGGAGDLALPILGGLAGGLLLGDIFGGGFF